MSSYKSMQKKSPKIKDIERWIFSTQNAAKCLNCSRNAKDKKKIKIANNIFGRLCKRNTWPYADKWERHWCWKIAENTSIGISSHAYQLLIVDFHQICQQIGPFYQRVSTHRVCQAPRPRGQIGSITVIGLPPDTWRRDLKRNMVGTSSKIIPV